MIHDVFITCSCVLHNILLELDGWDDWNIYVDVDDIDEYQKDVWKTQRQKIAFWNLLMGWHKQRSLNYEMA